MSKQNDIQSYYNEICKAEKINPIPVKFSRLKGLACVEYNTSTLKPLSIMFDLSKASDIEYALLHEVSHQMLLLTHKDPALKHNARFRKLEAKMIDKYMYSSLSFKYKL